MISAGICHDVPRPLRRGFQRRELRDAIKKKISALPSGAYCRTGAKKDGIGHSKVVTSRFVHAASFAMRLAEIERGIERLESDGALRPLNCGR